MTEFTKPGVHFLAELCTCNLFCSCCLLPVPLPSLDFLKSEHPEHLQCSSVFPHQPCGEQQGPFLFPSASGSHWPGLPSMRGYFEPQRPSSRHRAVFHERLFSFHNSTAKFNLTHFASAWTVSPLSTFIDAYTVTVFFRCTPWFVVICRCYASIKHCVGIFEGKYALLPHLCARISHAVI